MQSSTGLFGRRDVEVAKEKTTTIHVSSQKMCFSIRRSAWLPPAGGQQT